MDRGHEVALEQAVVVAPGRMEGRPLRGHRAVGGDRTVMAAHHAALGVIEERLYAGSERVRQQPVVGVEEHDERSGRRRQPGVARRGHSAVVLWINLTEVCRRHPRCVVGGAVVHHDQLGASMGLCLHTLDRFIERIGLVATRDDDRDQWLCSAWFTPRAGLQASPLHRSRGYQHRIARVIGVELPGVELLGRDSLQEGSGRQHVAVRTDLDRTVLEALRYQAPPRQRSEAPVPGLSPPVVTDRSEARHGREQGAAGLENALQGVESDPDVEDEMQRLGADDGVQVFDGR